MGVPLMKSGGVGEFVEGLPKTISNEVLWGHLNQNRLMEGFDIWILQFLFV